MKIPLHWLNRYVHVPSDILPVTQTLTAIGHMLEKPPVTTATDTILDLEVRQNRSDCLSILGVAREYAAAAGKTYTAPIDANTTALPIPTHTSPLTIHIETASMCRRFIGMRIDNINIQTNTPIWIQQHLLDYGMKPINVIVDITNFVMIELGQPLHAFDADQVGNRLTIRAAHHAETYVTLGNTTLALTPEDCVVADAKDTVIALAGIVGGVQSGVQDNTKNIVLEAATYRQSYIRRTSNRHLVRTEASTRHEKFLHPHLAQVGIMRASQLIQEICGGVVSAVCDAYPYHESTPTISIRPADIYRLTGVNPDSNAIKNILIALGFIYKGDDTYHVPFWRTDIKETADLVEEYIRIFGYDRIPSTLPSSTPPLPIDSIDIQKEERVRDIFIACGYDEQITDPFIDTDRTHETAKLQNDHAIVLENALNAHKNTLRTSLIPSLMHAYVTHGKYGIYPIHIFEIGKIYTVTPAHKNSYQETRYVAYVTANTQSRENLYCTAIGVADYCQVPPTKRTIEWIHDTAIAVTFPLDAVIIDDKVNTRLMLTTQPTHIRRDISIAIDNNIAVDDVHAALAQVEGVIRVSLGEMPTYTPTHIHILFHCIVRNIPVYEKIIHLLKTTYAAQIR